MTGWKRGDVVSVSDAAHHAAICVLTSTSPQNAKVAWLLLDDTCLQWVDAEWVEARTPVLLARKGTAARMDNEAMAESYTVDQIQEAWKKHAHPDDWGVACFYEAGLVAALRGEYAPR